MKPLCTSSSAKKPSLLLPNLSSQLQQSKPPIHGYQPQLNTTGHPMEAGLTSVSDQVFALTPHQILNLIQVFKNDSHVVLYSNI